MRAGELGRFLRLLGRYLSPHWPAVALLVALSFLAMGLAALLPLLIAPLLDLAVGPRTAPAAAPGLRGLTLNDLGAAALQWTGIGAADNRFHAIALLCAAYVAVGLLKGTAADFANYLVALWIRVRASAAIQIDLLRHLLGLSMRFFTGQRRPFSCPG